MADDKATRTVRIVNPQGLHMRPITALAEKAKTFQSVVTLVKNHNRVNVLHIIDMMTLDARQDSELVLEAIGPDAAAAIEALAYVIEHEFVKYDEESVVVDTRSAEPRG